MAEARALSSIAEISHEAWDACFADELENSDYLLAAERAGIAGFTPRYYVIADGRKILAAVPAFFTEYDLATTTEGWVKHIFRLLPFKLKLACLGSAVSETCMIGMHPSCSDTQKSALFAELLDLFARDAKERGARLLAMKDVSDADKQRYDGMLKTQRFTAIGGMPTAVLPIDFRTVEDYLAQLSGETRKDMKRKLKKRAGLRIEFRRNIDDMLDEVFAMYLDTKNRSDLQFEELTPDFFREVMKMENSLSVLYFAENKIIGANLLLLNERCLLDKFFCMSEEGRRYNLYFISWLVAVELCLERSIGMYQSGQAGYEAKLRLKSKLLPTWMVFRHANHFIDGILRLGAPLLAFKPPHRSA